MNKKRFGRGSILFLLGAGAVILLVVLIAYNFVSEVRRSEVSATDASIAGIAKSNAAAVCQTMMEYTTSLTMTAMLIETFDDFKSPEVMGILKEIADDRGFARLAIDYLNGLSHTSDGYIFDFSSIGVLDKIAKGETFVGDITDSFSDGEPIVSIYVPLRKNGEPVASLRLALKAQNLENIFSAMFWNEDGYFHLIDGRGRFVATSAKNEDEIDDEEQKLIYRAPVGVGEWAMVVTVPNKLMWQRVNENIRPAVAAAAQIMSVFVIVFGCVIVIKNQSRKRALLGEKCFRVLADQTGKTIFEWDFTDNPIIAHGNFEAQFGRPPTTLHSEHDALDADVIHPEDRALFAALFHRFKSGENVDNVKFRIKDGNNHFRWCLLTGASVRKENGDVYKAIVSLENIDEKEREREDLKFKAMIDPLTGLYNKVAESYLVTEALFYSGKGDMHALVCFDLDGFKGINDKFGHLFGDTVLQDISDKLKQSFRASDILGRFGGDEFVLLVKHVPTFEFIREKVRELMELVSATYKVGDTAHSITASIGVAVYPDDAGTYEELYEKADIASYKAKTGGKNRAIFYSDIERSV